MSIYIDIVFCGGGDGDGYPPVCDCGYTYSPPGGSSTTSFRLLLLFFFKGPEKDSLPAPPFWLLCCDAMSQREGEGEKVHHEDTTTIQL